MRNIHKIIIIAIMLSYIMRYFTSCCVRNLNRIFWTVQKQATPLAHPNVLETTECTYNVNGWKVICLETFLYRIMLGLFHSTAVFLHTKNTENEMHWKILEYCRFIYRLYNKYIFINFLVITRFNDNSNIFCLIYAARFNRILVVAQSSASIIMNASHLINIC